MKEKKNENKKVESYKNGNKKMERWKAQVKGIFTR